MKTFWHKALVSALALAVASGAVWHGCGFTLRHPKVRRATSVYWDLEHAALSWLRSQQRSDGRWGTSERRAELTGLAALAFLSRGEYPVSDVHGETLKNALVALLSDSKPSPQRTARATAILAWCLAEAYGCTRAPMLGDAARQLSATLEATTATPWHVFAAQALAVADPDSGIGARLRHDLARVYLSRTHGVLNQATCLLVTAWDRQRDVRAPILRQFQSGDPITQWRQAESPLLTAVVLSHLLFVARDDGWDRRDREFAADLARSQLRGGTLGWWTPASLGVRGGEETSGLTAEEEAIYATALMLLAMPPPRQLPTFNSEVPLEEDGEDVEVDIVL